MVLLIRVLAIIVFIKVIDRDNQFLVKIKNKLRREVVLRVPKVRKVEDVKLMI